MAVQGCKGIIQGSQKIPYLQTNSYYTINDSKEEGHVLGRGSECHRIVGAINVVKKEFDNGGIHKRSKKYTSRRGISRVGNICLQV